MENNINTKVSLKDLTAEQLEILQQFATAQGMELTISNKKSKNADHLDYIDDTHAICSADKNHQFDISILDNNILQKCKQTGLCPNCLEILDQATQIKQHMVRTRRFVNNQPSEEKAGYQIRQILKNNINNINDDLLINLQEHDFCKNQFKLSYPMLLDITNKSTEEVKILRKDQKGYTRYSPQEYIINDGKYLLTNNLYPKNLNLIKNYFDQL